MRCSSLFLLVGVLVVACAARAVSATRVVGAVASAAAAPVVVELSVNGNEAVAHISSTFLSVTMDAEQIPHHWNGLNFSDPRLLPMARALSPCVMRIGGTAEDGLTYIFDQDEADGQQQQQQQLQPEQDSSPLRKDGGVAIEMLLSDFDRMSQFVNDAGWKMSFGLNALKRNKDGSWNTVQASRLIALTGSSPAKYPMLAFELSNEPDLFSTAFNTTVSAQALAESFLALRQIVDQLAAPGVEVWGPDAANPAPGAYFYDFLSNITEMEARSGAPAHIIDQATIHHYYQGAPYTNMSDAVSVVVLDKLVAWFDQVDEGLRPTGYSQSKRPLSLGETSSFWGGGAVGISDRFVAGFTWLDKLGLAALRGWGSVFRQTFIGGVVPPFSLNYALVRQNLTPNPDFFNSVLFKRLVGAEVLRTKQVQSGGVDPLMRSYAFCTRPVPSDSLPAQYVVEGSVTVMWLSLHQDTSVTLQLEGSGSGPRLEYTMSSASQTGNWQTDMASYITRLNGVALELDAATGHLPRMPPRVVTNGASSLTLAPLTYGFVVLPHAQAPACGFKKPSVAANAPAAPAAQAPAVAVNKRTAHRRHRHARQADNEEQMQHA